MGTYSPTTWNSLAAPGISAAELNRIETGVDDAHDELNAHSGAGGAAHADVTTGADGFMTAADKTKLNTIEGGATADQTITAGAGLSGGGTGNVTLTHDNTSSQGSVNNSNGTVIQDITLDTYGHTTGLVSVNLDTRYDVRYFPRSLGYLYVGTGGSATNAKLRLNGTSSLTGLWFDSGLARINYNINGTLFYGMSPSGFFPHIDNSKDLGASILRWDDVYATNGTIQTSDPRAKVKSTIKPSTLGLEFVRSVQVDQWRMKRKKRIHYSPNLESVKAWIDDHGDFAGFIDPTVNPPNPEDADGMQGWRPSEFVGPMMVAIQQLADHLETTTGVAIG